jgi:hypothetical protein
MPETPRSRWQNYDYRAVTAGVIFLAIATIVLLSSPSTSLQCARNEDRCTIVEKSVSATRTTSLRLKSIERAKKQCDKSKGQSTCDWSVRLVVKGDDGDVFAGIKSEQQAERYVQAVRDFLDGRGPDSMKLSRPADLTPVWILGSAGLLLIVLGIRKNMVDKGRL